MAHARLLQRGVAARGRAPQETGWLRRSGRSATPARFEASKAHLHCTELARSLVDFVGNVDNAYQLLHRTLLTEESKW